MTKSLRWQSPRDMLRDLSPARLGRFVSRDWQANALEEVIFDTGPRVPPGEIDRRRKEEAEKLRKAHQYRLSLEAGGTLSPAELLEFRDAAGAEFLAECAWRRRGEALDVLRSLHVLRREHGPLPRFLHATAAADRIVAARLRAAARTSPPTETVTRLVTAENLETLLNSPIFWSLLLIAWKTAADDLPDRRQDVIYARSFLEAVVGLLAAPLREKGLHRAVRAYRAKAAGDLLRTHLPDRIRLLSEQERATRGLLRRSEILDALNFWQEEHDRIRREADAAAGIVAVYGTASVGIPVPCATCGGPSESPNGMTATAIAFYRRRHAKKGRRGSIPLREVAAAVLLHRCPDRLDARTVTAALERLKKRATPGKRA